jgi:hypothetical protein
MSLITDLVEHFHLPSEKFLHATLVGYLGIKNWTSDDGETIRIMADGSIVILGKKYAADMHGKNFLEKTEDRFPHTLYDKDLKAIVAELGSVSERLAKLVDRVTDDNGNFKSDAHIARSIIHTQSIAINSSRTVLNTIANYYAST